LKIIDIYIGKLVFGATLVASLGLVSLLSMFTFLEQLVDLENDYTMRIVVQFVLLSVPRVVYETMPFAILIGALTGLGQLANHSELVVLRSAGVSTWRIALATVKPVLVILLFSSLLGELVAPDFEKKGRLIREQAMEADISPGKGVWTFHDGVYMHFTVVNEQLLSNLSAYYYEGLGLTKTLVARSAMPSEEAGTNGRWVLEKVAITDFKDNQVTSERHETLLWQLDIDPVTLTNEILVDPERMSIITLYDLILAKQTMGVDARKFRLGFWTKIFQPLASLGLVFVSLAFVFGSPRDTSMGMRIVTGLTVGILFKFVQDLLAPASLVFGFSPIIAVLAPTGLCIALGYGLLRQAK
jgi:lipopolysaccharide export system permease protein